MDKEEENHRTWVLQSGMYPFQSLTGIEQPFPHQMVQPLTLEEEKGLIKLAQLQTTGNGHFSDPNQQSQQ